jgi:endonuclease/exonuclease/phosphatase family metal-dependent hydrolase
MREVSAADLRDAGAGLSVVSLNLAKESNVERITRDLEKVAAVRQADVFLFQEVCNPEGPSPSVAHEVAGRLGMQAVFAPASPKVRNQGLAVLSRYPIRDVEFRSLPNYKLRFRSRTRFALAVTVDTPSGPVRVYNAHLDTRINSNDRLKQLAPAFDHFEGPQIVGGDFNSNDFFWVANVLPLPSYTSQNEPVEKYMRQRGFVTPFRADTPTFDLFGMHLDWIWAKGFEPAGSGVHPMDFSDHHALVAVWRPAPGSRGRMAYSDSTPR